MALQGAELDACIQQLFGCTAGEFFDNLEAQDPTPDVDTNTTYDLVPIDNADGSCTIRLIDSNNQIVGEKTIQTFDESFAWDGTNITFIDDDGTETVVPIPVDTDTFTVGSFAPADGVDDFGNTYVAGDTLLELADGRFVCIPDKIVDTDTFAVPGLAQTEGVDVFGVAYTAGANIVTFPSGATVCVPDKVTDTDTFGTIVDNEDGTFTWTSADGTSTITWSEDDDSVGSIATEAGDALNGPYVAGDAIITLDGGGVVCVTKTTDTFGVPSQSEAEGTDAYGEPYVAGANIITFPGGGVVCVPEKNQGDGHHEYITVAADGTAVDSSGGVVTAPAGAEPGSVIGVDFDADGNVLRVECIVEDAVTKVSCYRGAVRHDYSKSDSIVENASLWPSLSGTVDSVLMDENTPEGFVIHAGSSNANLPHCGGYVWMTGTGGMWTEGPAGGKLTVASFYSVDGGATWNQANLGGAAEVFPNGTKSGEYNWSQPGLPLLIPTGGVQVILWEIRVITNTLTGPGVTISSNGTNMRSIHIRHRCCPV